MQNINSSSNAAHCSSALKHHSWWYYHRSILIWKTNKAIYGFNGRKVERGGEEEGRRKREGKREKNKVGRDVSYSIEKVNFIFWKFFIIRDQYSV